MGKIVIPKHSADIDEMNAVLRIHYEADDWVKGTDFKKELMSIIGANQYPSSYPKKAQVPAYFGFIESKVSSGGRITERKITESGRAMYEAILSNDRASRQRLILEALEKIVFGRNNAGCTSSNSDIEAPTILVKCILDTGYCTSAEYAHLVWSLNDKCKNYYETLDEVIKARCAGGITVNSEADDYKDWKPILAMLRWGFLIKSDDDAQKVLLHPEVIDNYSSRLQRLKIYNIDKHELIEEPDFDDINIGGNTESSYKAFKVDDDNLAQIPEGHFLQSCKDIEQQKIYIGDQVLLVDRQLTRLVAYYSYLISNLEKKGSDFDVNIKRQFAINKNRENELIMALKVEDELAGQIQLKEVMLGLMQYDDYEMHLKIDGHSNKDILPAYLILKALLSLHYMTDIEQDYLVHSVVDGKETYSDVLVTISNVRKGQETFLFGQTKKYSQLPSVKSFKDKGIFEVYFKDGNQGIQISPLIKERYADMIRRLSFYAVDIEQQRCGEDSTDNYRLPKVIKAILVNGSDIGYKENQSIFIKSEQVMGGLLVQGDFIVFVDEHIEKLRDMFVFQIVDCKKKGAGYEIVFERRNVINPAKECEIIGMIKEA